MVTFSAYGLKSSKKVIQFYFIKFANLPLRQTPVFLFYHRVSQWQLGPGWLVIEISSAKVAKWSLTLLYVCKILLDLYII